MMCHPVGVRIHQSVDDLAEPSSASKFIIQPFLRASSEAGGYLISVPSV